MAMKLPENWLRIGLILLLLLGVVGVLAVRVFEGFDTTPDLPVARIDLPKNALVTDAAITAAPGAGSLDEFVGRYTTVPIAAGETLKPERLSGAPILLPRAGLPWLGLPLDRGSVAKTDVNSGDVVLVCEGTDRILGPARLSAVLCSKKQSVCTGLVRVAPGALAALSKVHDPGNVYLGTRCEGRPEAAEPEASEPTDLFSTAEDDSVPEPPKEGGDEEKNEEKKK